MADTGNIPSESLEALITTIPKPSKAPDSPANFSPISLLNTDTKIFAKLIATQLSSITLLLVYKNQVGFVTGRQASDGTRQYIDLIQWAEHHRTPSLLLSLDAEKAFSTEFIGSTCQRCYTNLVSKGTYLTLSLVYITIPVPWFGPIE